MNNLAVAALIATYAADKAIVDLAAPYTAVRERHGPGAFSFDRNP